MRASGRWSGGACVRSPPLPRMCSRPLGMNEGPGVGGSTGPPLCGALGAGPTSLPSRRRGSIRNPLLAQREFLPCVSGRVATGTAMPARCARLGLLRSSHCDVAPGHGARSGGRGLTAPTGVPRPLTEATVSRDCAATAAPGAEEAACQEAFWNKGGTSPGRGPCRPGASPGNRWASVGKQAGAQKSQRPC